MTSLEEELAEQARWRLRPGLEGGGIFETLVHNEFAPPEVLDNWRRRRLASVLKFAAAHVPYYRDLVARIGLAAEDFERGDGLRALPVLTKHDVQDAGPALRAARLPEGHIETYVTRSSGTTGRVTVIAQTNVSGQMFPILKQREYRWFRYDPMGKLAAIRTGAELRSRMDGPENPVGETFRAPGWRYVGEIFETGPFAGFNITNPIDAQLEWLARERPDYLVSQPSHLENLAHKAGGANPAPGVRGVHAISEQMTASMRRRIEAAFGVRPVQNYGLNEIGVVASQCEAGRFHVHLEHCMIEITDGQGRPCAAGEEGHLLVTTLTNFLMPLIRYDTGDLARAQGSPCPCGRTLPSFGPVTGRYRRYAGLPEETIGLLAAVRFSLEAMPPEIAAGLRLYQLHQDRGNHFELRLAVDSPLPPEFHARIRAAWDKAAPAGVPLDIVEVAEIAPSKSGKIEDFTSDFMAERDVDETD